MRSDSYKPQASWDPSVRGFGVSLLMDVACCFVRD